MQSEKVIDRHVSVCMYAYMHITKNNERRGNAFERLLGGRVWREKRRIM